MLVNLYDNEQVLFQHYMDMFDHQAVVQQGDIGVQTCPTCVNNLEKVGVDVNGKIMECCCQQQYLRWTLLKGHRLIFDLSQPHGVD